MLKKSVLTIALAGALFATGQFAGAGTAQAGIEADLRGFLGNPSKNLDSFLNSKDVKSLRNESKNENGSMMERLKNKCASLKKSNNWNVNCDW